MLTYLKPNIQLFAEGGEATHSQTAPPAASPTGKTYTEDYVNTLQGESEGYRTTAKTYESTLRAVLGIKDGEDLGDLNARVSTWQQTQKKQIDDALSTANQRLINAELKSLDGYDHKLLIKVIDLSKVTVDDQGNVTGMKEAAEEAAKEFPAVKASLREPFVPNNPPPTEPPEMTREAFTKLTYSEKYEFKQKHPEQYKKLIGGN